MAGLGTPGSPSPPVALTLCLILAGRGAAGQGLTQSPQRAPPMATRDTWGLCEDLPWGATSDQGLLCSHLTLAMCEEDGAEP